MGKNTKMSMTTPIRKVEGRVSINFFANATDVDAKIQLTSRKTDELIPYYKQLFAHGLKYTRKYAYCDSSLSLDGLEHQGCCILGEDSNIGWMGSESCNEHGDFEDEQFIIIKFANSRNLTSMIVAGDVISGEYPLEFTLTFYAEVLEKPTYLLKIKNPIVDAGVQEPIPAEVAHDRFCASFNPKTLECTVQTSQDAVMFVKLEITKWSKPKTNAKINYFSSEMISDFSGDRLRKIEVLEEKTADVDKLSYGLSSNYCKIEFLNEDYKFFDNENYQLLRKNREVLPYIKCGEGGYRPLGKFYSDEWTVPSDSKFMTVKAYDILYSLKDVEINYCEQNDNIPDAVDGIFTLNLIDNDEKKISEIIRRVQDLVNRERKKNGVWGNDITIVTKLVDDYALPHVFFPKKSAWDILQDIADVCCAYVYVDRDGRIIFEQDWYEDACGGFYCTAKKNTINMDNSFSYSLPVSSRNIVNKVSFEYNELVGDGKPVETLTVKRTDLTETKDKLFFTIKPTIFVNTLYISNKLGNCSFIIEEVNYDSIVFSIDKTKMTGTVETEFADENKIGINPIQGYKLEKTIYLDNKSYEIVQYGAKEYAGKANTLCLNRQDTVNNSTKILKKYSKGKSYLIADWTGDDDLMLGGTFQSDEYDENGNMVNFTCMSNELSLECNGRFRQKTKGIESTSHGKDCIGNI